MAGGWIRARQTKYVAYASVYILVVLTLVVVANVLADRYSKTYDSTSNKRYTLSDQTAKIVKGLSGDATITYFDQASRFTAARDLLGMYAGLSPKIHVKYVDPDNAPQVAHAAGVTAYGTTVVEVGEKTETAKSLTEEEITGAFIRDIKGNTRTVCFLTGSGERRLDDTGRMGYSQFKDLLGKDDYVTQTVNLLENATIPDTCTVVVVGGPTSDYLQPEVDALQKYVEGGGRAMMLLDPPLNVGEPKIHPNDALGNVLKGWGVTLDKDLILDMNPVGQMVGLGPQVALVTTYTTHAIVGSMSGNATAFPMARSLEVQSTDKSTAQKLFDTSDTSFATSNLSSPAINTEDPSNRKGPLTVGAAGTYTTDKPDSQGRFVVIGNSDWASNSFLDFNGNGDLAMNSVNWLASDEDLISIRPKDQENRPITMTGAQMNWVRLVSQAFLPLIVVLAGVFVWRKRR